MKFEAILFTIFLASVSAFQYTKEALADKIVKLPGTENLNIDFNQFSGYLSIPGANGNSKHMHYWHVESTKSPSTDPLTFWTNGGPGCSGLIGFMTEQGPFRPIADGTLKLNEFAWNKISNMVFIESPAGVGFSYSDEKDDYNTGDQQTAIDNYNLIQAFLERFPHFTNTSLYISSESYGGHYMPTLAKEIVTKNSEGVNPTLNFKGFAVGNPYTDVYSGTPAGYDTYWGHQIISKPVYDAYQKECVRAIKPNAVDCLKLQVQMNKQVGNLNPYALDYPVCLTDSTSKAGRAQRIWFRHHQYGLASHEERAALNVMSVDEYEPCTDNYGNAYLNREDVKMALHVKSKSKWTECSNKINYDMNDSRVSTAPIYNFLIDGGYNLNILVYSGDDDSVCGTIGTQNWIWSLGYEVQGKPWRTYTVAEQTAGYLTQWKNTKLAFLTVHGAGHEVPAYKPQVAFDLFQKYINGEFTN